MKRRGFLKLLGLSSAAVVVAPALAQSAPRAVAMAPELGMGYGRMTATEVIGRKMRTDIYFNAHECQWFGYAVLRHNETSYDYAEMLGIYSPDHTQIEAFQKRAAIAMRRAITKGA